MSTNLAWSIKGVDEEAKALAKRAAQISGMTMGAWLEQAIMLAATSAPQTGANANEETKQINRIIKVRDINMMPFGESLESVTEETVAATSRASMAPAPVAQNKEVSDPAVESLVKEVQNICEKFESKLSQMEQRLNDISGMNAPKVAAFPGMSQPQMQMRQPQPAYAPSPMQPPVGQPVNMQSPPMQQSSMQPSMQSNPMQSGAMQGGMYGPQGAANNAGLSNLYPANQYSSYGQQQNQQVSPPVSPSSLYIGGQMAQPSPTAPIMVTEDDIKERSGWAGFLLKAAVIISMAWVAFLIGQHIGAR